MKTFTFFVLLISALVGDAQGIFPQALIAQQQSQSTLLNGLQLWYRFNEGSGGTALDSSGNGFNGGVSNAVYSAYPGGGYSLFFNGTSAYVDSHARVVNTLGINSNITVSAWINQTNIQTSSYLSDDVPADAAQDIDFFGNNGPFWSRVVNTGGAASGGLIVVSNWYNVVTTYNGAGCSVYTNGTFCASYVISGVFNSGATNVFIGKRGSYNTPFYWNGYIKDVRIYNRVLISSEISQLYSGGAQ